MRVGERLREPAAAGDVGDAISHGAEVAARRVDDAARGGHLLLEGRGRLARRGQLDRERVALRFGRGVGVDELLTLRGERVAGIGRSLGDGDGFGGRRRERP